MGLPLSIKFILWWWWRGRGKVKYHMNADVSWRFSAHALKLWGLDGSLAVFFVLWAFWSNLYTFFLFIVVSVMLIVCEHVLKMPIPVAARRCRAWVLGKRRPSRPLNIS